MDNLSAAVMDRYESARDALNASDRIEAIGRRYLRNITQTPEFQNARRAFDREGPDLVFRANQRSRGINNYYRMYDAPYSRDIYMGVRNAQGSGR